MTIPNLSHLTRSERRQLILDKINEVNEHLLACPPAEQIAGAQTLIQMMIEQPIHAALCMGDIIGTEGLPLDKACFTTANRAVVKGITNLQNSPKYIITSRLRKTFTGN